MTASDPGSNAARFAKGLTAKAKRAAATLKAEYEAGKQGDQAPAEPIWPSPKEQFDGLIALLRASRSHPELDAVGADEEAGEMAEALRRVDWASVRSATNERTGEATKAVKAMAEQVDWARVQPVATQVSRALIAAIAAGQLPVAGRLGATVARAITNQGGLGVRVVEHLDRSETHLPDEFRNAIETTSRVVDP